MAYGFTVRIWGDMALFTRPETKAERVSYDVITPSAVRGILESVFWHPGMKYVTDSITVLKPVRFDAVRRNEVGAVAKLGNIKSAYMNGGPLYLDSNAVRQQRSSVILRDVDYLIDAHFDIVKEKLPPECDEKEYYNILLRRLRKGQHFAQPCLGCREFPANIVLIEEGRPTSCYESVEEHDLGFMLYDMEFGQECTPIFYHAVMRRGVIKPEVRR